MLSVAPTLTIYSTTWCGPCVRLKRALDQVGIDYTIVDIEDDPAAAALVMEANRGMRLVPTVELPDGTLLGNPTLDEIQRALGMPA